MIMEQAAEKGLLNFSVVNEILQCADVKSAITFSDASSLSKCDDDSEECCKNKDLTDSEQMELSQEIKYESRDDTMMMNFETTGKGRRRQALNFGQVRISSLRYYFCVNCVDCVRHS